MKRILSFHIVSQVGYMILGLGLFTVAGIGAAILYALNQIVLKSTLLLTAGIVDHNSGSSRLSEVGGLARRFPLVGWLFILPALSLAGVPPFCRVRGEVVGRRGRLRQRCVGCRGRGARGERAHALLGDEDLGRRVLG